VTQKNLFLIGSGLLQAVNALEAFDHFLDDDAAPSMVISNRERRNDAKFKAMLDSKRWGPIYWREPTSVLGMIRPPLRTLKYKQYTYATHRLLRDFKGCDRLFLSQYTEFNRHLANWLSPREIVYITDGIEVVVSSEQRAEGLRSKRPLLRERLRHVVYGWRPEHPKSMVYFSALEPTLSPDDTFVENRYPFICRHFGGGHEKRPAVAFLGQPLYPPLTTRFSFDSYWERLSSLVSSPGVTEYWPHPKEDPAYVDARCEELGIKMCLSGDPVEIALLKVGCPQVILSFLSTALYTCRTVFASLAPEVHYVEMTDELEQIYSPAREALEEMGVKPLSPK